MATHKAQGVTVPGAGWAETEQLYLTGAFVVVLITGKKTKGEDGAAKPDEPAIY
jgi:hypothetical protein